MRWWGMAAMLAAGLGAGARAQDVVLQPGAAQTALPTLHVYTDLVQVSALVEKRDGGRLAEPLAANRFSVSIGNGPRFPVTHVHIAGDEPISLSILLDVNGNAQKLMEQADEAIADLSPELLSGADRVSIYALDCSLVRGLDDAPADKESLRHGVQGALTPWMARIQAGKEGHCKQTVHLREALASMVGEMRAEPGHRVIVAVTDGQDRSSGISWADLKTYAQMYSVAIMGVKYLEPEERQGTDAQSFAGRGLGCAGVQSGSAACAKVALYGNAKEDPFSSVCQLSGGSVLVIAKGHLWDSLVWVSTMLRERYVVEYPRPANSTAGIHGLDVRVAKGDYVVLPSGVSFPPPNQAALNDPTTVADDPARRPKQGGQRVLMRPK